MEDSLWLSRYIARLRGFIRELAGLPAGQFAEVVKALEEPGTLDLAVLYAASVPRITSLWLIWEDYCRGRGSGRRVCREVQSIVEGAGPGMGVVTFFNREVKSLIVKSFNDLSPGILVPGWVLAYSARMGQPLAERLRGLGPVEQASRLPGFVAAFYTLEAVERAMLDYYASKRSDFAYTTAGYVYWEIVKPSSLLAEVFAEAFAGSTRLHEAWQEAYNAVLGRLRASDSEPPRLDYRRMVSRVFEEARKALIEELRRERILQQGSKNM